MSDEDKQPEIPEKAPESAPEPPPPPNWEFKREFAINKQMREVAHLAISATESELTLLRRKLEKLQYGS